MNYYTSVKFTSTQHVVKVGLSYYLKMRFDFNITQDEILAKRARCEMLAHTQKE